MGKPKLSKNRVSANGSLRIDRQIKSCGIPRLQISSGTTSAREARERNNLISLLIDARDQQILQALHLKKLSVTDLWEAYDEADQKLEAMRAVLLVRLSDDALNDGVLTGTAPKAVQVTAAPSLEAGFVFDRNNTSSHVVDAYWGPIEDVRQKAERAYRSSLWKALLSPAKWPDSPRKRAGAPVKRTAKTVKRYKVSMRALQDVVRLCTLETAQLKAVASVKDETLFLALRQLRRRGVSFDQAVLWATATEAERDEMGARDFRVGDTSLGVLTHCAPALVEALRSLGERVPRLSTAQAVFRARKQAEDAQLTSDKKAWTQAAQERKANNEALIQSLDEIGEWLHADACLSDLLRLQDVHWAALYAVWGASDVDWMQMRRALMAALSSLTGSEYDPLRGRVIERIPSCKLPRRTLSITIAQYRQMLSAVSDVQRNILITITVAGLRIAEYEKLRADWLDHNTCTIYPNGKKTEGSVNAVSVDPIYWPNVVQAVPAALKRSAIRKLLIKAAKAAGIKPIRVHDLRHCLGHFAGEGGASREELQAILRHKSPQMTDIYTARPKIENAAKAMATSLGATDASSLAQSAGLPAPVLAAQPPVPSRGAALHALSRKELYERVWTKPIEQVAKGLDVSDVLVHKRCSKLNIPTPPRGYWQRKARGYDVIDIPPLPTQEP
ncbi:tyrosine-type recombinase/integrase [Gemmatimonas sp.]|uniref:tyrosine-type recombinase/integrase n=1 Tax=Gemmatimonas sp. TaxID=1962908 RepID=UPI0037BFD2C3